MSARWPPSLHRNCRQRTSAVGAIEAMDFPDAFADVVICSSVLHFARDEEHFLAMVSELWRVLRPGGLLFCRLGSRIGMDFERVRRTSTVSATAPSGSSWMRRSSCG